MTTGASGMTSCSSMLLMNGGDQMWEVETSAEIISRRIAACGIVFLIQRVLQHVTGSSNAYANKVQ